MLMYFVLVVQFGSFLDPLAILVSLPLSLIGVVLGLLVTGATLNLMSMIGVILLMGIVAKNAILLIDFAKWSEESGMSRREAIIQAGRVRLRPILMTTFALIAGMVPVAIGAGEGADFRRRSGAAVIGGVLTSTVLTLLVIPTVYEILTEWRDWLGARVFKSRPATVASRRHRAARARPGTLTGRTGSLCDRPGKVPLFSRGNHPGRLADRTSHRALARNAPARQLYLGAGFAPHLEVFVKRW